MSDYICPNRFSWLKLNHLSSFDQIWSYPAEWFEEPNSRRGGWSGVGRIAPQSPETGERGVFLKRQESHVRRTLRHPFSGEPTFACEFRMMRFLHAHGVPAPVPVFFGERLVDGKPRAILMTEELAGYKSLEEVSASLFTQSRPPLALQRALIRGVAETVKKLHVARIQHRSLYPKHLFVSWPSENDPQVAVIDLEKSRFKLFPMMCTLYDLSTLNRHSPCWSNTARMYFLMRYFGVRKLSSWQKLLCRLILKRSRRRAASAGK